MAALPWAAHSCLFTGSHEVTIGQSSLQCEVHSNQISTHSPLFGIGQLWKERRKRERGFLGGGSAEIFGAMF